jgi:ribosomal protein L37AE/L43A
MDKETAGRKVAEKRTEEATMTVMRSSRDPAQKATCKKCGVLLNAPECSEFFPEERLLLNLWSCTSCGNKFETEAFAPADARSKIDHEVLEEFFPSLLVA